MHSVEHLRFKTWFETPKGVAVLRGGAEDATALIVAQSSGRPIVFIVGMDRFDAASINAQLSAIRRIEWRLSRGLSSDLATAVEARNGRPIVICADVLASELAIARKQCASKLEIISGYPLPPDVIDATVVAMLSEVVARYVAITAVSVVVHDRQGLLGPIEVVTAFDVGEIAGPETGALAQALASQDAPAGQDTPGSRDPSAVLAPSLHQIRAHAAFLSAIEVGVLADMHRFLKGPKSHAVLAHWRRGFAELANVDPALAKGATARLNALALDIGEPMAREPRAAVGAAIRKLQDALQQGAGGPVKPLPFSGALLLASKPTRGDGSLPGGNADVIGRSNRGNRDGLAKSDGRAKRDAVVLGSSVATIEAPVARFAISQRPPTAEPTGVPRAMAGGSALQAQMISLAEAEQARSDAVVKALANADARSRAALAVTLRSLEDDRKRAVAQAIVETRAMLAAEQAEAVAAAITSAEAASARDRDAAVTLAVREASEIAGIENETAIGAMRREMAAAVEAARVAATTEASEFALADTETVSAAIAVAVAAAEARFTEQLRQAEEVADRATVEAVSRAVRAVEAEAIVTRDAAIAEAVATVEAAAQRSEAAAIDQALAATQSLAQQQSAKAIDEAVARAVSDALASAAADKARAIDDALSMAASTADGATSMAILEALEAAAAEAETSQAKAIVDALSEASLEATETRDAAIADALARAANDHERRIQQLLADADAAAESARDAAVADALGRAATEADDNRERAVLEALAAAADAASRNEAAAVSAALSAAAVAAQAMQECAVADALAAAAAAFERDLSEAVATALASAAEAAKLAEAAQAQLAEDEARLSAAEDAGARRQRLERFSKLSLADVVASMSDAGRQSDYASSRREAARPAAATCRAFLRPMRQQQTSYGIVDAAGSTELSRIKDTYDIALRAALTHISIAVPPRAVLVTLGFQVSDVGRAELIELISPSGDVAVDAASLGALSRLTLPVPPVEVGGGIAYAALLHFE